MKADRLAKLFVELGKRVRLTCRESFVDFALCVKQTARPFRFCLDGVGEMAQVKSSCFPAG